MNVQSFFAMGGYAIFVWPAYALTAAALGLLCLVAIRRYRRAQRRLDLLLGGRRGEDL